MKQAVKFGGSAAATWGRALAVISGPVVRIACCRAAQRDEVNGYSFTAAMEWRKAAGFMALVPAASDYCWKQWERIMLLPRRLAAPIVEAPAIAQMSMCRGLEPGPATNPIATPPIPLASPA